MKAFPKLLRQILPQCLACALKSDLCNLGYLFNKYLPGAESIRDIILGSSSELYFYGSPQRLKTHFLFPTDPGTWQYYYYSCPVDEETESPETSGLVQGQAAWKW